MAAIQTVIVHAPRQGVIACAAPEPIVTGFSGQLVVFTFAVDGVVSDAT